VTPSSRVVPLDHFEGRANWYPNFEFSRRITRLIEASSSSDGFGGAVGFEEHDGPAAFRGTRATPAS
jgi:hypothetical protein